MYIPRYSYNNYMKMSISFKNSIEYILYIWDIYFIKYIYQYISFSAESKIHIRYIHLSQKYPQTVEKSLDLFQNEIIWLVCLRDIISWQSGPDGWSLDPKVSMHLRIYLPQHPAERVNDDDDNDDDGTEGNGVLHRGARERLLGSVSRL